jgi:Rrf2 family protein
MNHLAKRTRSDIIRVMAHLTVSVEYGIHSLLWMVDSDDTPLSCRDLAEFQGLSQSFLAKIFPKLEKAGIVSATEGARGGYLLARAAEDISLLEVVDAIEGQKPLFDCQEIRGRCVLFAPDPPSWALSGYCSIHAVMLRAEKAMRAELAKTSLRDIASAVGGKAPPEFPAEVGAWMSARLGSRTKARGTRAGHASQLTREMPS